MESLTKMYRDLEMQVLNKLRTLINKSKVKSDFVDSNAIKINHIDFVELVIINDSVIMLDENGNHYNYTSIDLEMLIEIIEPKR